MLRDVVPSLGPAALGCHLSSKEHPPSLRRPRWHLLWTRPGRGCLHKRPIARLVIRRANRRARLDMRPRARLSAVLGQWWEGEVCGEDGLDHITRPSTERQVRACARALGKKRVDLRVRLQVEQSIVDAVIRGARLPMPRELVRPVVRPVVGADQVCAGIRAHPWDRVFKQARVVDRDHKHAIKARQVPCQQRQRAACMRPAVCVPRHLPEFGP